MMRKILLLLCACFLVMGHCIAESSDAVIMEENKDASICSWAFHDDTVCMLDAESQTYYWVDLDSAKDSKGSSALYLNADMTEYRSCMSLVESGEGVFSIVSTIKDGVFRGFELCGYDTDGTESVIRQVDLSCAVREDGFGQHMLPCAAATYDGHWLCVLFEQEGTLDTLDVQEYLLLTLNVETGDIKTRSIQNVVSVYDIVGGRLVYMNTDSGNTKLVLTTLNLEDMAEREIGYAAVPSKPNCATYGRDEKTLYYAIGARVYGVSASGDAPSQVAALPTTEPCRIWVRDQQIVAATCGGGVYRASIDWNMQAAESRLTIFGGALKAYEIEHPDIQIVDSYDISEEELITNMLSRQEEPDILVLNTASSNLFFNLKNRDYLAPIQTPQLAEYVNRLYPGLKEAVTINGKVCAIPLSVWGGPLMTIDNAYMQQLGISRAPATWEDFRDLLNRWPELWKQHSEIIPVNYGFDDTIRSGVFEMMFSCYDNYRASNNYAIGFDTPSFRRLMEVFNSIDFETLDALYEDSIVDGALFDYGMAADWSTYMNNAEIVELPMEDGMEVQYPISMRVICINPNSKKQDLALDYLNYTVEQIDVRSKLLLEPGFNTPQRGSDYDAEMERYQSALSKLQERLLDANEMDRQAIETEIDRYTDAIGVLENAWAISEDAIQRYRQVAPKCFYAPHEFDSSREIEQTEEMLMRYYYGEMTLDAFIERVDQRLDMMWKERQADAG